MRYRSFVECQKQNVKKIFYRGDGDVSAVAYILDAFAFPHDDNYIHCDGYLNDPYEGETVTQMLYLFSEWDSEDERDLLWKKKRNLFQSVNYTISAKHAQILGFHGVNTPIDVTVQVSN
jgi:hypothetical protein